MDPAIPSTSTEPMGSVRRAVPALAAGVLALMLALAVRAGVPRGRVAGVDHDAFDEILRAAVHGELVDYGFIRDHRAGQLDGYLGMLAQVDPDSLGRDERLAFYIDLYNASMIRAVLDRMGGGWTPAADDFAVFDVPVVGLDGERVSLNHLENEVIRPGFGDPRVHAALVCAARSCPPLRAAAYRGDGLGDALDERMRRFVNDPARNTIDVDARRLELSRIFDWYADDFGGADAVDDYVDRYTDRDVRGWPVSFLEYSWALNAVPAD